MVFTIGATGGVQEIHRFIRGQSAQYPDYYAFGSIADVNDLVDTLGSMPGDILHRPITWSQTGSNSLYEVTLATTQGNGSYINAEELTTVIDAGSGVLYTIDDSVIFLKDDSFFVQIEGEVRISN